MVAAVFTFESALPQRQPYTGSYFFDSGIGSIRSAATGASRRSAADTGRPAVAMMPRMSAHAGPFFTQTPPGARVVAEVGQLLGFQDAPAFRHAFKGWQGLGPGPYRSAFAAGS